MTKVAKNSRKKSQTASSEVMVRLADLSPCPENELLYRPVVADDPDTRALAKSIRENGVREPLVVTRDHYILSGHRRWTAARLAGLVKVPCRVEPIYWEDCDSDEVLRLLREHNRQRVKSLDEMLREGVASVDPDEAHALLLAHRRKKSDMSDCRLAPIELTARRARKRIGPLKQAMLGAAIKVIEDRREFWPLSVRQIHYTLLNDPPLRNSAKSDSRYANDRTSYAYLCDLLTRARVAGLIRWQAIADETRPVTLWRSYAKRCRPIRRPTGRRFPRRPVSSGERPSRGRN
ncbi:MAG: ParB/RepB/Spo0J family partition protein [Phycisphaerae bacterium]|nr:ParB/RepB/Spo0J family partition protein [Phycisphaerae bacterium]